MVFTRFSGCTESEVHSWTDRPENRMPPAAKVFSGRGTKIQKTNPNTTLYAQNLLRCNWVKKKRNETERQSSHLHDVTQCTGKQL